VLDQHEFREAHKVLEKDKFSKAYNVLEKDEFIKAIRIVGCETVEFLDKYNMIFKEISEVDNLMSLDTLMLVQLI